MNEDDRIRAGQRVEIIAYEIPFNGKENLQKRYPGIVMESKESIGGWVYYVAWFIHGTRNHAWFWPEELEVMNA